MQHGEIERLGLPEDITAILQKTDETFETIYLSVSNLYEIAMKVTPRDGLESIFAENTLLDDTSDKNLHRIFLVGDNAQALLDEKSEKNSDLGELSAFYDVVTDWVVRKANAYPRATYPRPELEKMHIVVELDSIAHSLKDQAPFLDSNVSDVMSHYTSAAEDIFRELHPSFEQAVDNGESSNAFVDDDMAQRAVENYFAKVKSSDPDRISALALVNLAAVVYKHADGMYVHYDDDVLERIKQNPEVRNMLHLNRLMLAVDPLTNDADLRGEVEFYFYPPEDISSENAASSEQIELAIQEVTEALSIYKNAQYFKSMNKHVLEGSTLIIKHILSRESKDIFSGTDEIAADFERIDELAKERLESEESASLTLAFLGLEAWRKAKIETASRLEMLHAVHGRRNIGKKIMRPLKHWRETHFANAVEEAVQRESEQVQREALDIYLIDLEEFSNKYHASSRAIRDTDGGIRYRTSLLEHFGISSGREQIMSKQMAQDLAFMVLNYSDDDIKKFAADLRDIDNTHKEAEAIVGSKAKRANLSRVIDHLSEQIDSGDSPENMPEGLYEFTQKVMSVKNGNVDQGTTNKPEFTQIDPATLDDIKDITFETDTVNIEVFPPGTTEKDIIDNVTKELYTGGGEHIDWSRIRELVGLYEHFSEIPGATTMLLKSKNVEWSSFPYYLLEVRLEGKQEPILIAESPVYGNATYVVEDADWPFIVQQTKATAREYGAKPFVHSLGADPEHHTKRLKQAVHARLDALI